MTYSVLIEDIMVQKGIYWTIGEHLYIFNCPIVSYQMIKFYSVETMDMERFRWNNSAIVMFNNIKYYGDYYMGLATLVEVL